MSSHATPRTAKSPNDVNNAEQAKRPYQLEHWRRELTSKINVYDGELDDFLDIFVPSNTPCPLDLPNEQIAEDFHPVKGREVHHYDPLINIFSRIVADFPEDRRLSFCNTHAQELFFPFSSFAKDHHTSKPDISVSFPGVQLASRVKSPDWTRFSMVIEAKSTASEDAFDAKAGITRTDAIVQLAISARSLMFAHGMLAAYTLGIYGDMVRIARFDHACAVASEAFSIKSVEGLRIIQEFFWRFTHPWHPTPGAVVGHDETVSKITPAQQTWLREHLGSEADELLNGVDLREGRVVKVWDDREPKDPSSGTETEGSSSSSSSSSILETEDTGFDSEPKEYILFKLVNVNARLFSRSTMVWLGIEYDTAKSAEDLELRIIKEAWRQLVRIPESTFYRRLRKTIPLEQRIGLPGLVGGGDLGAREVAEWEAASKPPCRVLRPRANRDTPRPPPHPMHQTFTWRLTVGSDAKARERSHMRLVVDTVGRPLSRFRSTKELVTAIRDAIKGHRLALERGGILHRDISSGNILIVDKPRRNQSRGILHDLDYSSMTLEVPTSPTVADDSSNPPKLYHLRLEQDKPLEHASGHKERTGTYYFFAIDLLDPTMQTPLHQARHDLESFYWVLLWIVLRHTVYTHVAGQNACETAFVYGDDLKAVSTKRSWLVGPLPTIPGNEPLTELIYELTGQIYQATLNERWGTRTPLTYDALLATFNRALARDDWPVADGAIPFYHGDARTNSVYADRRPRGPRGSKRARDVEALQSAFTDIQSGEFGSAVPSGEPSNKRNRSNAASDPRQKSAAGSTAGSSTLVASSSRRGGGSTSVRAKSSGSRRGKGSYSSRKRSA
ncbi:hypothetical protein ONZ51_g1130 [Trametes cubensis]|uniref:Fungal-type protein kinase domain-containing protein n=1 Tax=Trametes cubensis TaxID=1111947 RepID=A0AAD7U257_9APHY|nr:hypothetical protein ONZ51_g1130 [Trametes cubensis]